MPVWVDVVFPAGVNLCLSYAVPEIWQSQVSAGALVRIPIGKRESWGLVLRVLDQRPQFPEIKEIIDLLDVRIGLGTLKFWQWLAEYYMSPWNRVLDVCLPNDFEKILKSKKSAAPTVDFQSHLPDLTSEQFEALQSFEHHPKDAFLLFGITGSGKSRVMLEMALKTLAQGKQVLWLVPEIGLTPQTRDFLSEHLGVEVNVLHSSLSAPVRRRTWQRILESQVQIVLGTRSALLAPMENLGLILLDEEHDSSYKQADPSPRYHARDAALWRGRQLGIPVVLASATPSLESYALAEAGRLRLLKLTQRPMSAQLPRVQRIDMKEQRMIQGDLALSYVLREAMADALERGEQIILLHNRRGFAKSLICKSCGQVFKCKSCDVSMALHKKSQLLQCHYCDAKSSPQVQCPHCGHGEWQEYGMAIEKVEEEIRDFFPGVGLLRLDRDSTAKQGQLEEILNAFRNQDAQILLGTQMVVKGHDFPMVSLVGVIAADQALQSPDFRAAESAFQLLTQVAGRAGRGEVGGLVLLQCFDPEAPVYDYAVRQDYESFYQDEILHRQLLSYPPQMRLLKIEIAGRHKGEVWSFAKTLGAHLQIDAGDCRILGPADAVISLLRGEYRVQFLIFSPSAQKMRQIVQGALAKMGEIPRSLKVHFDMDPRNLA